MPNTSHPHPAPTSPGVIELRLQTVKQLFNSMDPTPFPEKDLDADAEEFIVSWAKEFPRHVPLVLLVHLAQPPTDRDPATMIELAVREYFTQKAELTRRHFRQMISQGRLILLIGIAFLASCLAVANLMGRFGDGTAIQIVRESLIIGGWVAMWRPMEIFLYDWWPLRGEKRLYERLAKVDARVVLREG